MRKKENSEEKGNMLKMRGKMIYSGFFFTALIIILVAVLINSCTKDEIKISTEADPLKVVGIDQIIPANLADSVIVDPVITVKFVNGANLSQISSASITLKNGTTTVPGTSTFADSAVSFTPKSELAPDNKYTATVKTVKAGTASSATGNEYSWNFKTGKHNSNNSLSVVSVDPVNNSKGVGLSFNPTVTFNKDLTSTMTNSITLELMHGSNHVKGVVSFSGATATLKPDADLAANTVYTGKVNIQKRGSDNHHSDHGFSWSFTTTATTGGVNDVTAPAVLSAEPLNNATSVAVNSKATATFSEAMNSSTISASTFTLKQGTTSVAGTVSYSGTIATFTPGTNLANNTVYTATITTGAKDVAGNAIAANYTWSFTTEAATGDVTPPTVVSVVPANNATSVAINSKATATFSEAMNSSTISASTFTLKQGTTSVAGTVSYSGTIATFTPGSNLANNTVYTATITIGAKDVAGNAIAANYTWSFTTEAAAVVGMSFASDVVPALNACNACHTHGWKTSTVASTFYANLVSGGYVNAASYTTSKLYTKINGGHPGSSSPAADLTKILTWMSEGSKNN